MDIEKEVMALAQLDGAQLRQRWEQIAGSPAPGISPSLLRLALAWRIQADALGGLSASARRRLAQAAGGRSGTQPASAGTRLVREWQGATHIVTVDENGAIRWNGREFASLSAVARTITGGHWSGPAFFGLRKTMPGVRQAGSHQAHNLDSQGSGPSSKAVPLSRTGSSSRSRGQGRTAV